MDIRANVGHIAPVIALGLALASGAAASTSEAYWPVAKVRARIDDARVSVGGRQVRVVSALTLCSGEGPVAAAPRYPDVATLRVPYRTFTERIDRDLEFRVRVRGGRRFRIVDAEWIAVNFLSVTSGRRPVQASVRGLRPGADYAYRFRQGARTSEAGRFRTAPAPGASATVEFAISGDADATRAPGASRPAFNRLEVYARMAGEANDFNVNLGDTIDSDFDSDSESGVGGAPALTVAQKWAKYRLG